MGGVSFPPAPQPGCFLLFTWKDTPPVSRPRSTTSGYTSTAGSSYLIPGGVYLNAGGIDTSGVEFSATVQMPGRTYCESLNV